MSTETAYESTKKKTKAVQATCYHCGTVCIQTTIHYEEKVFCCEGCKLVYELLEHNGLCNFYELQSHPGLSQVKAIRQDKYSYLDDPAIAKPLYRFDDGKQASVTFFIPAIHCSSCMWLLEHLYKINPAIIDSRIQFADKKVTIRFMHSGISLRGVVEMLATIGYEPLITLDDSSEKASVEIDKSRLYKLGVAGFCFGNIMLMSFPEYLSGTQGLEHQYALLFRILNLILSIPVIFYAAQEFFINALAGLRQKVLNIDAPIALAILITYGRSIYEIVSGNGGGYLDSMSGIVFFMLVGRVVQDRVYRNLTFHRDYRAYFPMAATVVDNGHTYSKAITELERGDIVQVYHQEIIPADGILTTGNAYIDYSFVTGENEPVAVAQGERLFAGGRQTGKLLTMKVSKPVSSSYLTSLWNHGSFSRDKQIANEKKSVIHLLSKYFSLVLFSLAALTALYWWRYDPAMILPSVSAMLIVACPCALLLTATYTNGNLLRIFSDNGLYLRDATVIEQLSSIQELVFDKTGTLTVSGNHCRQYGATLDEAALQLIYNIARASNHPKSRQLTKYTGSWPRLEIQYWEEQPGKGITACCGNHQIRIGSAEWVGVVGDAEVYVRIDDRITSFSWEPELRNGTAEMLYTLKKDYRLSLLSGDNNRHASFLQPLFDADKILFYQQPADKLHYIANRQEHGYNVAMIGDGLNDAGALQQSDVGITLADDINNFSPACDAILSAEQITLLPALLQLARQSKIIIRLSFIISILYNIVGLGLSMRGLMNPMIAAILMPASTLTIVLITTGASNLLAARLRLRWREKLPE